MAVFIPKKLKVGYQSRQDTFTGKLAYINYENDKKVWALDKSWKNWVKEEQIDFIDNEPISGFIINRSKTRYASFAGKSVNIRIYHPNGFEFEISPDNLCAVISHSDISHSYISQECILGWEGGRVLLIPTNSDVYQSALKDTKYKLSKFEDDFVFANSYIAKKSTKDNLIYLGKEQAFTHDIQTWTSSEKYIQISTSPKRKGNLFYNTNKKSYEYKTASQIAEASNPIPLEEAQNLLSNFKTNPLYQDIYSLPLVPFTQDYETVKRMFLYTLIQRIFNYSSHQLRFSASENSTSQQIIDNACSQGIILKNDIDFGLKIMKNETYFSYRLKSHSNFDYAVALYTTDPINIFNLDYHYHSKSLMAYLTYKSFCEFLLEYNTTKQEIIFNNGYSCNFTLNNHHLSDVSNFLTRFFKFEREQSYLNSDVNSITNFEKFNKQLQIILQFIETKFDHFDSHNHLVQNLFDMSAFKPTFDAMRQHLKYN